MTTITYLIADKQTKTFDIDLPDTVYCRMNLDNKFDQIAIDAEDFVNDPKNMYYYQELTVADSPLFAFIALYKQDLLPITEAMDTTFDEVITYNDITSEYSEEQAKFVFGTEYIVQPPKVVDPNYVPPNIPPEPEPTPPPPAEVPAE
jgi:hypothetical protein